MVGGGTKLSIVKKMMEKMSGKELSYRIDPDEAVVRGAAMQGALMEHNSDVKDLVMTDICPYYIGINTLDWKDEDLVTIFTTFIRKNTVIPTKHVRRYESTPRMRKLELFQSGDEYGTDKLKIGECTYIAPETEDEVCPVIETMIYDHNGIVSLEVYVPEVDKTYGTTIVSDNMSLNMEEAKKHMEELKNRKLSPREKEEDLLLIAQAELLYSEILGSEREHFGDAISALEAALGTNKKREITQARENLKKLMRRYSEAL